MGFVLFENGKIIGEVEDWIFSQNPPQYKEVLGKTVLASKANDQCTFTSPKPIHKKGHFTIRANQTMELSLQVTKVQNGTLVTATVLSQSPLKMKSTKS